MNQLDLTTLFMTIIVLGLLGAHIRVLSLVYALAKQNQLENISWHHVFRALYKSPRLLEKWYPNDIIAVKKSQRWVTVQMVLVSALAGIILFG